MANMHINREMHKYSRIDIILMDGYQHEIEIIKRVLQQNPKGMTVTDISHKIKINRNSVAKYLDIMRISGQVEMITFGPAKVFFPSKRVPICDMINHTSDYILVFDADLKITLINNSFLDFLNKNRENIIGDKLNNIIFRIFEDSSELIVGIQESLEGKRFKQETDIEKDGEIYFFSIKIVPTTFEDGRTGGTIVIKNITAHKIAENMIRKSQENFSDILKKINKKP
jgi:PAS domain S-box-containing protein